MEQNFVGLRCPRCLSRWVRANITKGTFVCRRCGFVWDQETKVEVTVR